MALKDRILDDINKVFLNLDHFAEYHYWNGIKILCVPDEEEALKRKNNNVNDISWQEDMVDKVLFVPEDSLPARAQPNEQVIYDGVMMKVLNVIDAIGMKEIHLTVGFAKGVAL